MGKQAFSFLHFDEANILPDRDQILGEQAIQDIIRKEAKRCERVLNFFARLIPPIEVHPRLRNRDAL